MPPPLQPAVADTGNTHPAPGPPDRRPVPLLLDLPVRQPWNSAGQNPSRSAPPCAPRESPPTAPTARYIALPPGCRRPVPVAGRVRHRHRTSDQRDREPPPAGPLAGRSDMDDIASAIRKLRDNRAELASVARPRNPQDPRRRGQAPGDHRYRKRPRLVRRETGTRPAPARQRPPGRRRRHRQPRPVDYPVIVQAACREVRTGQARLAIAICSTGTGCAITDKISGIRAAAAYEPFTARAAVEHNNANVLCLGAGLTGPRLENRSRTRSSARRSRRSHPTGGASP